LAADAPLIAAGRWPVCAARYDSAAAFAERRAASTPPR